MSAVFDVNGNKISTQLYQLSFGASSTNSTVWPILYCKNKNGGDVITLSSNGNLEADINNTYACADTTNSASDVENTSRQYVCTRDTSNKNGGIPYWKMNVASCDLNQIKNKGYIVYLSKNSPTDLVDARQKTSQLRYPSTLEWNYVYTNNSLNFRLKCNSNGTWNMSKGSQGCQGIPSLISGSKFYINNDDIRYVSGQTGKIFNPTTFAQHTGTLTKTNLSTFIATNGTKIDANCSSGTEYGNDPGRHYYECVNGNWVARGECK